jgi:hypothetical protein
MLVIHSVQPTAARRWPPADTTQRMIPNQLLEAPDTVRAA